MKQQIINQVGSVWQVFCVLTSPLMTWLLFEKGIQRGGGRKKARVTGKGLMEGTGGKGEGCLWWLKMVSSMCHRVDEGGTDHGSGMIGYPTYGTAAAVELWGKIQDALGSVACPACRHPMAQTGGKKQLRLKCHKCKIAMGANEGGRWMQRLLDAEGAVGCELRIHDVMLADRSR